MTSHEELKKYVAELLRRTLKTSSQRLIDAVVQQLEEDPMLRHTLARIEARYDRRR